MSKEKGLLDILQECLGLDYLSDLKFFNRFDQIAAVIERIPEERFSLFTWNDAVSYLTGSSGNFETAGDARAFLLTYKK